MYRIYWNLHKRCWSIQTRTPKGWRVTGHADRLMAYGITFKVSEAGRQRVLREGRKNVHAYAVADLIRNEDPHVPYTWDPMYVRYNPYEGPCFATPGGTWLDGLNVAYFTPDGRIVTDPRALRPRKGTSAALSTLGETR